jgi:hypothetical protein
MTSGNEDLYRPETSASPPRERRVESGTRATVAAGLIDEHFVVALREVARRESRSKPTPTGAPTWSAEEVDDLACDAIARVGPPRVVLAAQRAANDPEFEGWLRVVIRTELARRARDTPAGLVLRTVDDALSVDDQFVDEAGRWRLAGDDRTESWNGDRVRLAQLAWSVETRTIRRNLNAKKVQIAWREDVRAVCRAVLAGSGPLPKVVLGEVVAERFNVSYQSRFGYLDLDGGSDPGDIACRSYATDSTPGHLDDEAAARWMLAQFTSDERVLLQAFVDGVTVRGIGERIGCGKAKAAVIRDRITKKLRRLAQLTGDDGHGATACLIRIVGHGGDVRHSSEDHGHALD